MFCTEFFLKNRLRKLLLNLFCRKVLSRICGKTYNACERPASSYGDLSRTPWCYLKKRWFIDHLNKKGIPYDDLVVDDVTGVTFYESQKRTSQAYMRKLR